MPVINQRDVYLLPFPFGDENGEPHPYIILSINDANVQEDSFQAVMITSSSYKDDFSFKLTDEMFDKPLEKSNCHVRMHLIILGLNEHILNPNLKPFCRMKKYYFDQLMRTIGELVFNYEFSPL